MSDHVRLAGWSGIAFVICLASTFGMAPAPPDFDATGPEIRDYLADNRGGISAQGFATAIAVVFGIVFYAGLAQVVRSGKDGELWGRVVLVASSVLIATVLVGQAAFMAPLWIDGNTQATGDDVLRTMWSLAFLLYGAGAPLIVLVAGATALAGFRSKTVPGYVAWIAVLAVVVGLGGLTQQFGSDFGPFGLSTFGALMLFSLAASIAMVRARPSAQGVVE